MRLLLAIILCLLSAACVGKGDLAAVKGELHSQMEATVEAKVGVIRGEINAVKANIDANIDSKVNAKVDTKLVGLDASIDQKVTGKIGQQNIGTFSGGAIYVLILSVVVIVMLVVVIMLMARNRKKDLLINAFSQGVGGADDQAKYAIMSHASESGVGKDMKMLLNPPNHPSTH